LEFDRSADSLAQPFGAVIDHSGGTSEPVSTVTLRRDRQLQLEGFQVPSNKTGIVHCEQMCDLGGSFTVAKDSEGTYQLHNGTPLRLHDAAVLQRTPDGRLVAAWLGEVAAASTVPVLLQQRLRIPHMPQWTTPATLSYETQARALLQKLDANGDDRLQQNEAAGEAATHFLRVDRDGNRAWDSRELMAWCRLARAGELSLGQLIELASQGLVIAAGEMRLVGWTDTPIAGMRIRPGAAQETARTLVLVHLMRGELPPLRPDVNRLADIVDATTTAGSEPAEDGAP